MQDKTYSTANSSRSREAEGDDAITDNSSSKSTIADGAPNFFNTKQPKEINKASDKNESNENDENNAVPEYNTTTIIKVSCCTVF